MCLTVALGTRARALDINYLPRHIFPAFLLLSAFPSLHSSLPLNVSISTYPLRSSHTDRRLFTIARSRPSGINGVFVSFGCRHMGSEANDCLEKKKKHLYLPDRDMFMRKSFRSSMRNNLRLIKVGEKKITLTLFF